MKSGNARRSRATAAKGNVVASDGGPAVGGGERLDQAMGSGQVAALGQAYDRYGLEAYRIALTLLRNRAGAEAIVESVFVDLWAGPGARTDPYALRSRIVGDVALRSLHSIDPSWTTHPHTSPSQARLSR